MQKFSERLVEARNAKNMTQEALANAVGVTRSTVSSWERNRTTPNLDMIRRLSAALDCDLSLPELAEEAEAEVPAALPEEAEALPEEVEAVAEDAPEIEPAPKRPRLPWLIAAAAVLVCVAVAVLLTRGHRTPAQDAAAFTEYYRQQVPNEADRPYLAFENTHWEEKGDGASYTRYAFNMKELNGFAFDITDASFKLEGKSDGNYREVALTAADLSAAEVETHIAPGGEATIDGGFPLGEFTRVGAEIRGTDESGNALTFYSLIDFAEPENE